MAKLSYLQLTNRVLKRITQSEITDVSTASGHAKIITELINEAQTELWTETTNWYSLYTTRTFATVASTAAYDVASDWGRTIDLMDTTNNLVLVEDVFRAFDEVDPDADTTGNPTHFAIQGGQYRLHPIPAGAYTMRDRYWKEPTALSVNASTSDLPKFCENFLIQWSLMMMHEYKKDYESADRLRLKIYGDQLKRDIGILHRIKVANQKVLNKMDIFQGRTRGEGIGAPRFPSAYGRMWYR